MFAVEVIYCKEDKSIIQIHLELPQGSSVADALQASQIYTTCPETTNLAIGIFSKPATLNTLLQPGDRVEIYRPLSYNPMEKRRLRAKIQRKKGLIKNIRKIRGDNSSLHSSKDRK